MKKRILGQVVAVSLLPLLFLFVNGGSESKASILTKKVSSLLGKVVESARSTNTLYKPRGSAPKSKARIKINNISIIHLPYSTSLLDETNEAVNNIHGQVDLDSSVQQDESTFCTFNIFD